MSLVIIRGLSAGHKRLSKAQKGIAKPLKKWCCR